MDANCVNPHLVINMAHSDGMKACNNGNRYAGSQAGGVTHTNNAGMKCRDANGCGCYRGEN